MKTKLTLLFKFFFSIISLVLSVKGLHAQTAPGGINSNLTFWIKANAGTSSTTEGAVITSWTDQTSFGYDMNEAVAGQGPQYLTKGINFNPAADFVNATNGHMNNNHDIDPDVLNPKQIYIVYDLDGNAPHALMGNDDNFYDTIVGPDAINSDGSSDTSHAIAASTDVPHILVVDFNHGLTNGSFARVDGQQFANFTYDNANGGVVGNNLGLGYTASSSTFLGNISETFIYGNGTLPTGTERQQIETYLALKYGITLNQTVASNYLNSSGTVIWDATVNTSHKTDIFGIGEDAGSGLNQKVSRSVNDENGPILATTQHFTEANNDALRTTSLGDGNFIIMAHDNAANTFTASYNGGSNNRLSRVWKVDETGTVGNIYIAIPKASFSFPTGIPSVVLSNDTTFDETDTLWALTDDGTHYWAEINPADGQYISFAAVAPTSFPGGVSLSLGLWLKADVGTTVSTGVSLWSDQSGNGNDAIQANSVNQPAITNNGINFHPMIDFDGSDDIMDFDNHLGLNGNNAFTLFGIMQMPSVPAKTAIIANDGCGNGFAWYQENFGSPGSIAVTQCGTDGTFGNAVIAGQMTLRTLTRADSGNHIFFKDGGNQITGKAFTFTSNNMVLGETNGLYSNIHLSELIVFNTDLTENDRNKVQSYLALKYGITLDQTVATNYLNDSGTIIWDATANAIYKTDVFGIGEDSGSALNQKISRSVNDENGPILATTQHFTEANNDALRTTSLGDGNFIIMAHDNAANTFTASYNGGSNNRLSRVWKVDETGTVGNIYVAIPKASFSFPTGIPSVVLSNDTTFDETDTLWALTDDGTHYWAKINPSDGQYLAFASATSGFTVSETALTIAENAGTDTFTVVLDAQPSSNVVFDISSGDTDEATVDKATLTFTTANWNVAQIVTVTGVNDAVGGDDSPTITVSVNVAGSDNAFDALADQTIAITLTDDDFTLSNNDSDFIGFEMYPNPSNQFVYLRFNKISNKSLTINIYDMLGKLITEHYWEEVQQEYKIDVSKLVQGTYFLNIRHDDKQVVKKLIVQ